MCRRYSVLDDYFHHACRPARTAHEVAAARDAWQASILLSAGACHDACSPRVSCSPWQVAALPRAPSRSVRVAPRISRAIRLICARCAVSSHRGWPVSPRRRATRSTSRWCVSVAHGPVRRSRYAPKSARCSRTVEAGFAGPRRRIRSHVVELAITRSFSAMRSHLRPAISLRECAPDAARPALPERYQLPPSCDSTNLASGAFATWRCSLS